VAARFSPNGAIGQRLSIRIGRRPTPALVEIIGITPPVRATRVSDGEVPHVFFSYNVQQAEPDLMVRTRQSAATLGPELRRRVEALGTLRPVVDIRPMRDYVDLSIGDARFRMLMLTAFAAASLLLAGVGMYGTLAYLISQRTQEFVVRMALGATTMAVIRLVAREGVVLGGLGGAIGLAAALATVGGLRGLLYGVAPIDIFRNTVHGARIGPRARGAISAVSSDRSARRRSGPRRRRELLSWYSVGDSNPCRIATSRYTSLKWTLVRRVQRCATDSETRGLRESRPANERESRPLFSGVGCDRLRLSAAS
jgi:putative ABC transport system permease protein